MATKTFDAENCSMFGDLTAHLKDVYSMLIPDYLIGKFYRVIFRSSALMLKYHANKKNHRTGFSFKDKNGEFVYGCILTFNPPEDEESEDGGNWNLDFTFNQEDMKDLDESLDNYSDVFPTILHTDSYNTMRVNIISNEDVTILVSEFVMAIRRFLDTNSNDSTDDVELEMKHIFKATVGFEAGQKVYGLIPGDSIKQLIKADDDTSKNADNVTKIEDIKKEVEAKKAAFAYHWTIGRDQIVRDANGLYNPFIEIA